MTARNIEDIFGLSPLQEGMLFHTLRSPGSGVYIEQLCCVLHGNLDVPRLEEAWRKIVERHQALRISIVREGLDRPLQVVHRTVEPEWRREDWRALGEAERARRLEKALQEDRARGFDPTRTPLMRFALFRTGDAEWEFIWTFHHMLLDGWSASLVMDEAVALYGSGIRGREPRLERPIPYREFIAWLARQEPTHAREFWSRTLAGFTSCTRLPSDFPAGELSAEASEGPSLDERSTILPDALASELRAFCKRHRLTLSTVFQGALAVLLARLCGVREVLFGNTVSGRPSDLPGIESMVGLFINTLPVRASFAPDSPVVEWLHALQRHQAEARRYDFIPLVDVQACSRIPRGEPLFEVLLVLENYPERGSIEDGTDEVGLQMVRTRSYERTNYPLTVIVDPGPRLSVRMAFDRRRFEAATIERMLGRIETLLEGLAAGPPARLADLPLMREDERSRVLVKWNETTTSYPRDSAIMTLFDEQVRRRPKAVAVVCGERGITYSDLSRRADRIAARLRSLGVRAETAIGICAERSIEMIAGLLGILRAGGAWVPLDPSYPRERLALMMEDADVRIVLAQPRTAGCLPETRARVVPLEASDAHEDPGPRDAHAFATHDGGATGASGDRLACIFYTSGSTGRPKGVAVTHRAIVRLVASPNYVALGSDQTILQLAPISFDASLFEIWAALLNGGRLVLMPPGAPSLEELGREVVQRRVTTLWLTAPLFHQMVDGPIESLRGVTQLLAGGDVLSPSCVKKAFETLAETKLINGYGPTEGTTFTCCHAVVDEPPGSRSIPIGRPISNTRVYILDESFHPLPIGIAGELFIGGDGLARGYQHDPALTAARFVPDPIAAAGPGGRLYRSGDLARWLPDGTIEFLGRADHQTKIRGHRVEAGEVEALLGQHPSVSQAVVAPRVHESGERRLVAWVVPRHAPDASGSLDPQDGVDPAALRAFLEERLPLYMVPSAFVFLPELPLTASGKPDRLRLPTPVGSGADAGAGRGRADIHGEGEAPASPRSPIEEILAGIWARLLRVDTVGVHESFFDLGGHSLVATQVVSRIRERIGVELPLAAIFEAPTVAGLGAKVAEALEAREEEGRAAAGVPPRIAQPIRRLGPGGSPPPSFAQERLWFLDQLEPGSSFYTIPAALRLEGRLDRMALERSLAEIVRRHDVLRTTFSVSGGLPVPVVHPSLERVLVTEDLCEPGTERPANERAHREAAVSRIVSEEARTPFDLQRGPLFRARLLRLGEEEHALIVTMHHIVSDAWSIGVLVDEMAALYEAYSGRRASPLPELAIQYGDYAAWQREWLRGEVLEGHVAFWKRRLDGAPAFLDLPTDRPRPAVLTFRGSQIDVSLGPELSRSLRAFARGEDVTLFMVVLAAFQSLLHRHTGQADIVVGVPVAGRNHAEIEPLIGFFVNTLPVRTSFSGDPTFRRLLARVRRTALEAWAHQDLPFERLVEALSPPRDPGRTPVFQTMLVMDNAPVDDLRLPGLRVTPLSSPSDTAKFELVLSLADSRDGELAGSLEYNSDLFDEATIAAMGARLRTLLEGIVADPDRRISELPVLTDADAQCVQVAWNDTRVDDPDAGRCLHELIERRAGSSSGAIAVGYEDESLTYGALERRANALAHRLRSLGVGPDVVVAVCMERSLELIVALLGTLKAGGAYLPLDPEHPAARLERQIEATGPSVLLSQGHLAARLPESRPPTIFLAPDDDAAGTGDAIAPSRTGVRSLNLAYVIPTSGSTGAPKGVMIPHRGIVNRLLWMQRQYGLTTSDRVLQKTPITFDVSVWEIFWPLLVGARLVLARPGGHRDAAYLARTIAERGITTIHFVPSMLEQFLREPDLPRPGPLVRVISSGEALRTDLQERFFERVGAAIHNLYGPTEVSVDATFWPCERDDGRGGVPIGRPIANTRAYVLDRALRPVPPGGVGELHLAGIGLARGYRGRPDLTAACFVPDPLCPGEQGGRLYRTGDLSRQRSDGTLEYLGRVDQQAKIRGIRIEPAEVEAALGEHPAVRESAVVVREEEGAGKRLVGYIVAEGSPEPAELRAFLRTRLPEEMVPFAIRQLERMPLTPSGKLDRKALPAIGGEGGDLPNAFIAPRNGVEKALARIWSEVLGVARVGATDDLFDLGGHSLLATQILHRIRDLFDVDLPLRGLFEEATVEALARSVVTREPVPGRSEKVAAIANRIEAMPPEALRRTLAQRDGSKELT